MRNPQLNRNGELIHLITTEGLPRSILTHMVLHKITDHLS